jgi:hypothetical protein
MRISSAAVMPVMLQHMGGIHVVRAMSLGGDLTVASSNGSPSVESALLVIVWRRSTRCVARHRTMTGPDVKTRRPDGSLNLRLSAKLPRSRGAGESRQRLPRRQAQGATTRLTGQTTRIVRTYEDIST